MQDLKQYGFSDENIEILAEFIETKNEEILDKLIPEKVYLRTVYYKDLLKVHLKHMFKAFTKMFGEFNAYLIVATDFENNMTSKFLTQEERNFLQVFSALNLETFSQLCDVSTDFLLRFFDDEKHEIHEIRYCLALLSKGVDETRYDVITKLENAMKKCFEHGVDHIEKFDPHVAGGKSASVLYLSSFERGTKTIFTFLAMGKSEFLDKLAVIFLCELYGALFEIDLDCYLKDKNLHLTNEKLFEFMQKYPTNLLHMIVVVGKDFHAFIKEKNMFEKKDFVKVLINYDEIIKFNRDFLLGKSDVFEFDAKYCYENTAVNKILGLVINAYKNIVSGEEDEFCKRLGMLSFAHSFCFEKDALFYYFKLFEDNSNCILSVNFLRRIFAICQRGCICSAINNYKKDEAKEVIDRTAKFFSCNDEFIQHLIKNYKSYDTIGRCIIIRILALNLDKYQEEFLAINDSSKTVKNVLFYSYKQNPNFSKALINQLKSKKLAERKKAFMILVNVYSGKYISEISSALEVEENEKLKAEMEVFLSKDDLNLMIEKTKTVPKVSDINATIVEENSTVIDNDVAKIIEAFIKTEKVIKFIPVETFSTVKNSSGEDTDINVVKASLIAFAKDKVTGLSPLCDRIISGVDRKSLEFFAKDLFDFYIEKDAEAKHKWILYYCAIYGGEKMVDLYVTAINEFVLHSRGVIAADTVRALSLNSSPKALLVIDEMSRKFKHKQVRNAAIKTLEFIAQEFKISTEELADRLIPDFGFDEEMKLVFDFGTRKFSVFLSTKLELEIVDEKGKKFKNLPKISASDDAETAQKSTDTFKALKKSIKATVKTQTERLELAIANGRTWSYENFTKIFVKNPIMYKFATTLIWGVYSNGKLTQTFRYMDDGSFNTPDEEEFSLAENMVIGLVHPIELGDELRVQWREQLADYEVVQSILQLEREIFTIESSDLNKKEITFDYKILYSRSSLKTKFTKAGWVTGPVLDAGFFCEFEHHNLSNKISAVLEFSGMSIVYYDGEEPECNLVKLTFKNGKNQLMKISEVPPKIISEFYRLLFNVTRLTN